MGRPRDSEFESDPDDDDEEDAAAETNVREGPPAIGGARRRPLSSREFPVDQPDFEDDGTDPCPHCGAAIYADGEWCPKCGKYLSTEDAPSRKSLWVMVVIILLVVLSGVGAVLSR